MPSQKVIVGHLHSEDGRRDGARHIARDFDCGLKRYQAINKRRAKIQQRSHREVLSAEADVLEFIKGIVVFILIVSAAATLGYYLNKFTS